MTHIRFRLAGATLLLLAVAGCHDVSKPTVQKPYRTLPEEARRNTERAVVENSSGLELLANRDYEAAEQAFKRALDADVTYGPAHNNLGKVYFKEDKLYLAAWEFQYASKLLPHQPEPKNNLGLVLESAGKLNDAVSNFDAASALESDNAEYVANNARARLRRGDHDEKVRAMLEELVLKETRPAWASWAHAQLARFPQGPTTKPDYSN